MGAIFKILSALVSALPALLDWWQRRQAAKAQAETETRVAAIRSYPAAAWLHKFNEQASPGAASDQTSTDQPDADK